MLQNIDIYNVKFGDCFILENADNTHNSNKMLVDFGSVQKIRQSVINGVNYALTTAKSKYLMVTHFHSDHYKGIKELNKNIIFDEIYLPNYFSKDIVKLQFTLLSVLSESHPAYQIAYNLLSVIPDLFRHLNYKTQIVFVKRGECIYNNVDSFRILWPNVNSFDDKAKQLYDELINYYNINIEKLSYIEELTEEYFSLVPDSREWEGNSCVLQFEGFELRSERFQQMKTEIDNISIGKEKPKKRLKNSLSKEISSYQNRVCICFDNGFENNILHNKCVLFLSDICSEHLQEIIESKDDTQLALLNCYNTIKVPHHGTKDYFVENLPLSSHMVVPNGYAKINSWKITALYGWHYKNRKFICADYSACDYSLAKCECDAYKCNSCMCGFYPDYLLTL